MSLRPASSTCGTPAGAAQTAVSIEIDLPPLQIKIIPGYWTKPSAGRFAVFHANGHVYIERNGTIYRDVSPATGSGTPAGTMNYLDGAATLTDYVTGAGAVTISALLTASATGQPSKPAFGPHWRRSNRRHSVLSRSPMTVSKSPIGRRGRRHQRNLDARDCELQLALLPSSSDSSMAKNPGAARGRSEHDQLQRCCFPYLPLNADIRASIRSGCLPMDGGADLSGRGCGGDPAPADQCAGNADS